MCTAVLANLNIFLKLDSNIRTEKHVAGVFWDGFSFREMGGLSWQIHGGKESAKLCVASVTIQSLKFWSILLSGLSRPGLHSANVTCVIGQRSQ